jgi:Flp pilus assembly protein TadB
MFPDVKDLTRKKWGEEKANDLQFVRKIQTILKKMEKSNIVRILPKKNPWQLQRYALSSFKFQDSDKNSVVLATDEQFKQMQELLRSALTQQETGKRNYVAVFMLMLFAILSYIGVVWSLVQPMINSVVFIVALSVSVICSLALGRMFAQ